MYFYKIVIELLRIHCCRSVLHWKQRTVEGKKMASKHISLPSTFAEEDPTEWFQRFDICCRANEWDNDLKAKKLPTLLQGEALAIWLEMSEAEKASYKESKEKLIAQMAPVKFVSLGDFHARQLRPGESLSVFIHDL